MANELFPLAECKVGAVAVMYLEVKQPTEPD